MDCLRQEINLLEDVNKVLTRGNSTKSVVGMGFSGGLVDRKVRKMNTPLSGILVEEDKPINNPQHR